MNSYDKIFTIVMPTYNSEKTIRYSIDSIKNQDYDLSKTEVLIIDGGSTDKTLDIVKDYDFCKIIKNEKRLPEYAKLLGLKNAKGKFFIEMDSDESFCNADALTTRARSFAIFQDAHILLADKLICTEEKQSVSGAYANFCGDPFSYFMYKPKNSICETFENNIIKKEWKACKFSFNKTDKMPIGDGGTTTFDLEYLRENFSEKELNDIDFACSITDTILMKTGTAICVPGDNIFHRSSRTFSNYISKIKFRIINNIFAKNESGFSTREISKNNKKFLFPLYSLSIIIPLFDGIKLSINQKNKWFLLHPVYCLYATIAIFWFYLLKMFHIRVKNTKY